MNFLKTILVENLFKLVMQFLQDDEAIENGRNWVKAKVKEAVDSTETPWDNVAAVAFLKLLGFSDEDLKDF